MRTMDMEDVRKIFRNCCLRVISSHRRIVCGFSYDIGSHARPITQPRSWIANSSRNVDTKNWSYTLYGWLAMAASFGTVSILFPVALEPILRIGRPVCQTASLDFISCEAIIPWLWLCCRYQKRPNDIEPTFRSGQWFLNTVRRITASQCEENLRPIPFHFAPQIKIERSFSIICVRI
jgi:hypothetical protein